MKLFNLNYSDNSDDRTLFIVSRHQMNRMDVIGEKSKQILLPIAICLCNI